MKLEINSKNTPFVINRGNKSDLEYLYLSYSKNFPENEIKSLRHLENLMDTGNYELIILKNYINGELIGYAFVFVIEDQKSLWLDYIVIEEKYQSKGFGSILFDEIIRYFGSGYISMFIEVEIPTGRDINKERRLKYYKKLGTSFISIDYQLPTREGGFPMYLLYKPIAKCPELPKEVIKNSIKSTYEFIHSDIHNTKLLYDEVINTLK